ncbi:MAG: 50S ribosomal protein L4 [Sphingomonadaceae bacterium]|uniref:50S ribosomal protein L4 n=1 Tax=Thermaurantiacus sp. TaxID=2820283 RepID=UPI00298EE117|nr:50S ribosomal protein L4 [Thermaurantiacus sp.]MCS6986426.1 50S ribosomal protein L4 [Sphingomonadaceae bacterium]MDW8414313.1 50S ribosomal protein L4 [Thermaurantiacus sp.]
MRVEVRTLEGEAVGELELPEAVFGLEPRADILHRVVTWQLEKRRAPQRAAKERGDVDRTGKKWGRQKGSGRARHGDRAAPQFIGGGKAHGPRARVFAPRLNKRIRALGLRHALSAKARDGQLMVVDNLALPEARTRVLRDRLERLGVRSVLFVDGPAVDLNFALASRNLPKVDVLPAIGANVYDILNHEHLVLTRAAVEALGARLGHREREAA